MKTLKEEQKSVSIECVAKPEHIIGQLLEPLPTKIVNKLQALVECVLEIYEKTHEQLLRKQHNETCLLIVD